MKVDAADAVGALCKTPREPQEADTRGLQKPILNGLPRRGRPPDLGAARNARRGAVAPIAGFLIQRRMETRRGAEGIAGQGCLNCRGELFDEVLRRNDLQGDRNKAALVHRCES